MNTDNVDVHSDNDDDITDDDDDDGFNNKT